MHQDIPLVSRIIGKKFGAAVLILVIGTGAEARVSKPKKAKLSPVLKDTDDLISSSPDLHHKVPASIRKRPDQDQESEEESGEEELSG